MTFELNREQCDAVIYLDGPLLVLAGAGSGKTRVISAKVAHLLERGIEPARIAAITFTNKAAREMRERAAVLVGGSKGGAKKCVICTFHALGLSFVRLEAPALGLSTRFSVLDPGDAEPVVAELLGTTERARVRAAQWRISQWKNALVGPERALELASDRDEEAAARAYVRYGDALRAYQAVDFDDLITLPVALIERDAGVASRWRERFAHVLIDEYQDTNPAQYRFFRHLVGEGRSFTVVGDDDQAIYGFRGASADNLQRLSDDFPGIKVVKLEQNYRSATRILRSANALIANNPKLFDKRLWSALGLGDTIPVTPAADEAAEAELVVRRLQAKKFERRARNADFAILYRGNHQARAFEQVLSAQNIPYVISGGQSWFDRVEIKDVVAYLRVLANEDDDPAFIRALTTPRRGVGQQSLETLSRIARSHEQSLFAAAFDEGFATSVGLRPREAVAEFCAMMNGFKYRAEREPAGRILDELLATIAYEDYLFDMLDKPQAQARWSSVRDFAGWVGRKGESDGRNLIELAQAIALIAMFDEAEQEPDAVHLSTLHASKGLEFPHVFLVGVEEGILPHREAISVNNVDEERRLMYVGITRAQESLHLSWCRKRKRAGEMRAGIPSRFIGELAQDDLRHTSEPLTEVEAAVAKDAGNERLRSLRTLLSR